MNCDNNFSFVLPIRSRSQRVKKKNTRQFAGLDGGLTKIKISQALRVESMVRLYVTSDDDEALSIAKSFNDSRIILNERPMHLCQSTTDIGDLIRFIKNLVEEENIYWIHCTAPFVDERCLQEAWNVYSEQVLNKKLYDSLMSVTKIQQFIWSNEERRVINNSSKTNRWPQTQDLVPLYEINHAFYINAKSNYDDRIGKKPFCFEIKPEDSIDIDWPEDFEFAQKIWLQKTSNQ
ncbi:acylneuraminate cytidylyltransferase family protein [Vibrio sp. 99-8-1]|uniref:acylneuraminate cytidylyltransferase family protein n=1 Tax=Vibrio sp. 99-8-1 TaxID=2607602 RepID=UPI0014934A31|nr:acylneuraminate cytidylyltransferase family protein [Vibrio sp. 99-8-1]NOI68720.1 acylneuraminate cytidylyltransferase family protein [Vibrio sp. 99-8-1]